MADQSIKDIWFSAIGRESDYQTMVYYPGTGSDTFEFNFSGGYINREDIKAFMVQDTTRERVDLTMTFINTNTVKTNRVVPAGWTICIYRDTPKSMPLAKFVDGAIINATNLDRNAKQAVFSVSEMVDRFDSTVASVEEALVKVAGAVADAKEAVETANAASGQAADAVETANKAEATAADAEAKADAAVETADGAKATAEGIDAKATKAMEDAAAALLTAEEAETTANAIDGKATQAQKDAAAALEAVDVAKEMSDRVRDYPDEEQIRWKGVNTFPGLKVDSPVDWKAIAAWNTKPVTDGTQHTLHLASADNETPDWHAEFTRTKGKVTTRLNSTLEVIGGATVAGFGADSIYSKTSVEAEKGVAAKNGSAVRMLNAGSTAEVNMAYKGDELIYNYSGSISKVNLNALNLLNAQSIHSYNNIAIRTLGDPSGNAGAYLNTPAFRAGWRTRGNMPGVTDYARVSLYGQEHVGNSFSAIIDVVGYGSNRAWYFRQDGDFTSPGRVVANGDIVAGAVLKAGNGSAAVGGDGNVSGPAYRNGSVIGHCQAYLTNIYIGAGRSRHVGQQTWAGWIDDGCVMRGVHQILVGSGACFIEELYFNEMWKSTETGSWMIG